MQSPSIRASSRASFNAQEGEERRETMRVRDAVKSRLVTPRIDVLSYKTGNHSNAGKQTPQSPIPPYVSSPRYGHPEEGSPSWRVAFDIAMNTFFLNNVSVVQGKGGQVEGGPCFPGPQHQLLVRMCECRAGDPSACGKSLTSALRGASWIDSIPFQDIVARSQHPPPEGGSARLNQAFCGSILPGLEGKQKWELWMVNRKGDSTDPRGDLC
ncbi:unnamed protein product [Boreogadus saida]